MRKIMMIFLALAAVALIARAVVDKTGQPTANKQPASQPAAFLIDNFESGSIKSPREWWTFGIKKAAIAENQDLKAGDKKVAAGVGKYSFKLEGQAKNFYAGGVGTYLAKENQSLDKYNAIQLDIYGNGEGSGTLKIELLDDDNENWQVEQDVKKDYAPTHDDKLSYPVAVDWEGWQRVVAYFDDFIDENPKIGDDIWNPQQGGSQESGGLLQLQLICLSGTVEGKVNYNIDNVSLTVAGD